MPHDRSTNEPEWVRAVWIRQVTLCVRLQQWEAAIETFYEPWHREDRRQMVHAANAHQWFSCDGYCEWWHAGGREKHNKLLQELQVSCNGS